jgi:hypothetical protein
MNSRQPDSRIPTGGNSGILSGILGEGFKRLQEASIGFMTCFFEILCEQQQ